MLCKACQDIFLKKEWEDAEFRYKRRGHHPSIASFHKAVAEACQICTVLHDSSAIQRALAATAIDQSPVTYCTRSEGNLTPDPETYYCSLRFSVGSSSTVPPSDSEAVSFEVVPHKLFPVQTKVVPERTNSPEVFDQIRTWICECASQHETCGKAVDSDFKPTRLLYLGDSGEHCNPRVVISKEHFGGQPDPSKSPIKRTAHDYMTLSHCWGTSPMVRLLRDNEMVFRQSIAFEQLPKSFRHAIEVTKLLGLRYLWIDSLCIIQDSPEDWRKEAVTMADVYRNAYCNIAATSAADSSVGCFFDRNPNLVTTTIVTPDWEMASAREYVLAQPHETMMRKLNEAPLLRRAWVLQERMLAHRIVHFTNEQVFFECHEQLSCEAYPGGIPYPHAESCKKCMQEYFIHRVIDSEEEDYRGIRKELIEWNRIVERFTACSLTYGKDKLIALAGTAIHFKRTKLGDDRYLAGMWESQMPDALLWQPIREACTRPEEYRAPSWSWASVDGPINISDTEPSGGHSHLQTAEFWHADIENVDNNPMGQVTNGKLILFGILAYAHVDSVDEQGNWKITQLSRNKKRFHAWSSDFRFGSSDQGTASFDVPVKDGGDTKVPVVLVRYSTPDEARRRYDRLVYPSVQGLLLEVVEEGIFKRIGTFGVANLRVPQLMEYLEYPMARVITLI
ncbi:heterokaryon incompatibility protein-domain-containing protein [Paraphoma chrysanthemicola]|uniref:Heterokaryon incompatibility protein-domain-containing protein n=1 Tax=Paraphoma chrysanthemicola TaxID=798071 RepID=A0A8K0QTT2_9PLEO|nr:heterokaryon incompatibility protein-domain-containing protein [Paraphoma chrysanthemicola]